MNRKDYIDKVPNLLSQPAYRTIERDPTNKLKAKLITLLRNLKKGNMTGGPPYTSTCTHQDVLPPSFMDYQKSIKLIPP